MQSLLEPPGTIADEVTKELTKKQARQLLNREYNRAAKEEFIANAVVDTDESRHIATESSKEDLALKALYGNEEPDSSDEDPTNEVSKDVLLQ